MEGPWVALRDRLQTLDTSVQSVNTSVGSTNTALATQQPRQQYVWNTSTLQWERMTQPLVNAGTVNVNGPIEISPPTSPVATAFLPARLTDGTNYIGVTANPLRVDPTGTTTQPVSAASLPLPSGAATSAAQTTGNTSLSSIDGKLPALVSNRVPVDGSGVTQPVSGTFWQATQPVSAASLPLPSGAATSANQSTEITALQLIDDVVHVNDAAIDKVAAIGAQFDDTVPGTTTENSVRALRMSTRRELYGQIRDAAGNERGANVTVSNALVVDGSGVTQPVSGTIGTKTALTASAPAQVSVGVASGVLIAANGSRKGFVVVNNSSARISIGLAGAAAVLDSGITLYPGGSWVMDEYTFNTGAINAIASAAASLAGIQEFT